MADLHVNIKKSANTAGLRALANHDVELEYMIIPSANVPSALTLISAMNQDDVIFSSNVTTSSGLVTGLLLPKSAGK